MPDYCNGHKGAFAVMKSDDVIASALFAALVIIEIYFHLHFLLSYVYIEDRLIENCKPCSLESFLAIFKNIESKSPAFQLAAQRALVHAYNNDLVKYVNYISEENISDEDVDFILSHYGKTFEDFGRGFHFDEDTIYHRRDEYKKTIKKDTGIEVPKKYTKRKNNK